MVLSAGKRKKKIKSYDNYDSLKTYYFPVTLPSASYPLLLFQ